MSDENSIGLQTDPNDISNIERLIKAVDGLSGSLEHLSGAGRGMTDLKQMMTTMQATMVTGFTEMSTLAAKSSQEMVTERVKSNDRLLMEEEKAWEKLFFTSQAALSRLEVAQTTSDNRRIEAATAAHVKALEVEIAAENARALTLQALTEKRDLWLAEERGRNLAEYTKFWEQVLAKQEAAAIAQTAIDQKRDIELNQINQKRLVDYVQFWEKTLAVQELAEQKQLEMTLAARAKQVAANTVQAQASTSGASTSLSTAYASSVPAVQASQKAIESHTNAMNEAHALSRGLAGSLGGLWLTYGSAVPLLAGAAVASSLKNVLTVGREVENQLNFVFALSEKSEGVNLDKFLKITDSSLNSVVESANAMRMLAQNGLAANESLRVLPTVLNLATVGEMSVSQAALAVTGAVSAFGLEISQAAHVADVFAKAAASSNTSVLAMTESMKQASTVSSLFKVSLEDTASMIGLLAKINITGGAAGTSITNLLTNLYEPTEKGKKALKELGVETHLLSGELKPIPLLLEDMRSALAKVNESSRVELLGSITTVRGLKAGQLLLENIDAFKTGAAELQTLTGYTQNVVRQLEDSTTGSFERLGVVVQNTFVKAFAQASPEVQSLAQHLAELGGGKDAITLLGNLATNVTMLTRLTLDAIPGAAGLYAAYKVFGGLVPLFNAYTSAVAASTAATATAAVASAGLATGMGSITGTAGLAATALEAEATAAAAATAASGAFMALMLPALGALAIAAGAAAAVWLIFRDNLNEADRANTKLDNSLHVIGDSLDKEIARLEKTNELWDKRNGRYRDAAEITAPQVQRAQANVTELEAKVRATGGDPESIRNPQVSIDPGSGIVSATSSMNEYAKALVKADQILADLNDKEKLFKDVVQPGQSLEKAQNDISQLNKELEKFAKLGTDKNSKGEFDQPSADIRGKYASALDIKRQLLDLSSGTGKILTDGELERLNQLRVDFKQLTSEVQGLLGQRASKVDKKAVNDQLKADLERIQLAKELFAVQQKTTELQLQADNKAGGLGDIGLLEAQNQAARNKVQTAVAAARASIDEVSGVENKRAAEQKYTNQVKVGAEQLLQLDLQLAISKGDMFRKMADEQVKFQAKTLADNGQYVAAYLMEFQASYGPTIKRVEQDITTVTGIENYNRLQNYLEYLNKAKEAGTTAAIGKSLSAGFEKDLGDLQNRLASLARLSSGQAGLGAIFSNAQAAADDYSSSIKRIAAEQDSLQALANAHPEDAGLQKLATAELGKMQALAEQVRATWVSVGQSIGTSLTAAFGSGGTALGGLLQATIAYQAQKDKIKEAADQADKTDPVKALEAQQKAAHASTSAQISYYGNLATAAKGYFKEGSAGYQALGAVEKAVRVTELAEAVRMFVVKSSMLTGLLGIKVATTAEAAAAEGAYTLASIAQAGARAAASGVAAAVSAMVGWPFPLNIIALGATVAAVAALGVKISGAGSSATPMSAEARQAANGTGSVLGDKDAKSDSISKSLEAIAKDSGLGLAHTISMDNSLKQLVAGISGLASLLVQGTNLTSKVAPNTTGMAQNFVNSTIGTAILGGPLGLVINKLTGGLASGIIGKIAGAIFGGATSVTDTGLTLGSGQLGSVLSGGVRASQYTDTKTEGGWFSSDKYRTQLQGLSQEINDQFTLVIRNLSDTIVAGANALGLGGDAFTQKLQSFVIDLGSISTKGLTGDQIEKALETSLSKLGDDMARFGIDGLQKFQQVGEGYLQTLTRVANDYIQVSDVLAVLGKSFNVTGLAAVDLSESLILSAGGIEKLTTNTGYFIDNFLTDAEKMKPVGDSLTAAFGRLQVAMPTSISGFKDLVLAQDLNTSAGQSMYAALISIAPQFKAFEDYLDGLSGVVIKSSSDIRSERDNLQGQLDKLTMTPAQLQAKERGTVDPSNQGLYDQVAALNNAKDAAAALSNELGVMAQIAAVTGDTAAAASVLERQHQLALKDLTPAMADLDKQLWAVQAAAAAAATYSSQLSLQAQIYDVLGDKAGAAAVLQLQHQEVLKTLNPALVDLTQQLWAVQAAAAAASVYSSQLDLQAQIYDTLGDKAGAAAVLQKKHEEILKTLNPALVDLTEQLWAVQAASAAVTERKGLQDSLDAYLSPEDQIAKQRALIDPGNRNLFDQLQAHKAIDEAYKAESKSIQDTIDKTKTFVDTLAKYKNSLVLSDASPLTPQEKYLEAKRQFDITLSQANAGDVTAQENFTSVADAFLQASKTANASSNQYVQDYQSVRDATETASKWAQNQLDVQKASLSALNAQVAGLAQIDASVKSVSQAIIDFMKVGSAGSTQKNSIETLYQSLLGRASDAGGMKFYLDALNQGVSIAEIAKVFLNSPEYAEQHPTTPAGPRVVMHGNIAADTDPIAAKLDALIRINTDQAEEIRKMRADQKDLVAAQVQADFEMSQKAANQISEATDAAANKVVNSTQSKVAPK